MQLVNRLKEWLRESPERRRAERHEKSGTVAYYWDGSVPLPREIRDISLSGVYLRTPERWYPGTIVKLTLRSNGAGAGAAGESIEVCCRVVRHGPDGVGLQFISQEVNQRNGLHRFVMGVIANLRRNKATRPESDTKGQALIEFALLLPFLLLLIFNVVNMGTYLYAFITVSDAARAGAQYAVLSNGSIGAPATAGSSAISSVATADTFSSAKVCVNYNSTTSAATGSCSFTISQIPGEPEPGYTLAAVDVQYNYTPPINLPSFCGLPVTIPST
jgi:uncharacterized protein (UPF0333 family)